MKNIILNELDDDILDHISGGTNESEASDLNELLKPVIGICSNCGARVMLSGGPCSQCGVTPTTP